MGATMYTCQSCDGGGRDGPHDCNDCGGTGITAVAPKIKRRRIRVEFAEYERMCLAWEGYVRTAFEDGYKHGWKHMRDKEESDPRPAPEYAWSNSQTRKDMEPTNA
jgi:hypothetical protein